MYHISDNEIRKLFVYNPEHEHLTNLEDILKTFGLDFEVVMNKAWYRTYADRNADSASDSFYFIQKLSIECGAPFYGEPLEVVSEDYGIHQNHEVFEFATYLIEQGAIVVNGGSIDDGALNFVILQLREESAGISLTGETDTIKYNVCIISSHKKIVSSSIILLPIRLSCSNQIPTLFSNAIIKIRHTKNSVHKLDSYQVYFKRLLSLIASEADTIDKLTKIQVTVPQIEELFLRLVLEKDYAAFTLNPEAVMKKLSNNKKDLLRELKLYYHSGPGQRDIPDYTAYKVFNAITGVYLRKPTRSFAGKFKAMMLGANHTIFKTAIDYLLNLKSN
jgi:hypothetical protein